MNPQEMGGHARAEALTPERRSEIGKAGAAARWKRDPANKPVDDGIREIHGCLTSDPGSVRIWEEGGAILVRVWKSDTITSSTERRLCPAQARYLADRLYDLARRVDGRRA